MRKCSYCGTDFGGDDRAECNKCGAKLLPEPLVQHVPERFCEKCGAKEIYSEKGLNKFDSRSGKQYKKFELVCPNHKHFMDGHDRTVWDNTEETVWDNTEEYL